MLVMLSADIILPGGDLGGVVRARRLSATIAAGLFYPVLGPGLALGSAPGRPEALTDAGRSGDGPFLGERDCQCAATRGAKP
jgi:hypothetical protein